MNRGYGVSKSELAEAGIDSVTDTPSIEEILQKQYHLLSDLENSLAKLDERLSPILRPADTISADESNVDRPRNHSDMFEHGIILNEKANRIGSHLWHIMSRIEL